MRRHSSDSGGPRLAPGLAFVQGGARRQHPQTGAVGVAARAQPPARLGVDLGVVGHRQADLALGDVALRRAAALSVRLDVLLADGLLLQQVADLHDVADDLHGARQSLFTG